MTSDSIIQPEDIIQPEETYMDFLQRKDHSFVLWRLTRTPELDAYWNDYIGNHPKERAAFDRAVAICDSIVLNSRSMHNKAQLFQRIRTSIQEQNQRHARRVRLWRRVAAAAAIFLLLLIPAFYTVFHKNDINRQLAQLAEISVNAKNVELVIDNQRIVLRDSADVRIVDGRLWCNGKDLGLSPSVMGSGLCKLVVQVGKHSFLTLADRSKVWINSATEVNFPIAYASSSRDIHIKGEIYIDVAKNPDKPFTVHTRQMDVLVHGTQFNVSAYPQEQETSVVLVRGKVQAITRDHRSVMMQPDQRIVFSGGNLTKEKVNVSSYVSWKDGYLLCNSTPVADVLHKVTCYYGVTFDVHNTALTRKRITGKLYLSSNIDDILTSTALMASAKYTRTNNRIILDTK